MIGVNIITPQSCQGKAIDISHLHRNHAHDFDTQTHTLWILSNCIAQHTIIWYLFWDCSWKLILEMDIGLQKRVIDVLEIAKDLLELRTESSPALQLLSSLCCVCALVWL